jgi:hypothetical protein
VFNAHVITCDLGPLIDRGDKYFNIHRTEPFIDFHASLPDYQNLVDNTESKAAKREPNADMNILQMFCLADFKFYLHK